MSGAASLSAADLSAHVAERYAAINRALADLDKRPVRFWNYVPGIVDPMGAGLDRYMAFNRGRHTAYAAAGHQIGSRRSSVPTASAIGVSGPDLVIHCLASDLGGTPVENPRQVASWRYSRRYGPSPPFFARGTWTMLDGHRVLLLGGTAAIVGEDSRHPDNLEAQVAEVLTNMSALIENAGVLDGHPLARLTDVRVYVVNAEDAERVEAAIVSRTGKPVRIESALSRVCRPELLVEVEGVASLDDPWLEPAAGI
jgi:enamine deaminase RidA (YjgF/YER057c/UK114 family)